MICALGLMRRCWCVCVAAAGLVSPPAAGTEQTENKSAVPGDITPRRLSLVQAQDIALERNWDLLAGRSRVDAATAQKIVAREFPNPTLSASSTMINVDHHPSSTPQGNGLWDRSYDTVFRHQSAF